VGIYLARKWREQPQHGVQLARNHPLAVGIGRVIFPLNREDLVSGQALSFTTLPQLMRYGRGTVVRYGSTAGGRITVPTPTPAAGYTMGVVNVPINGSSNEVIGFAQTAGSSTAERRISCDSAGATPYYFQINDGASKQSGSVGNANLTAGARDIVVGRCTNAFVIQCWFNGFASTTTACANNGFAYTPIPVFGINTNNAAIADGGVQIAVLWYRALTVDEISWWSECPWLVLERDPHRVYGFTAPAGGADVLYPQAVF
jgi:hypothetical protein